MWMVPFRADGPVGDLSPGHPPGVPLPGSGQEYANRYDPKKHHRRSIRLKGYDCSQAGFYHITICVQDRSHRFGEVVDGEMRPNDAGGIFAKAWAALPGRFPTVALDTFIVMPNHVHGILEIVPEPSEVSCVDRPSLGTIIGAFKSLVTVRYINGVADYGWPPFHGRLLQRNYFEHIVRDEESLERIRFYILNNPARWHSDQDDPEANGF